MYIEGNQAVIDFVNFIDTATRDELDEEIANVKEAANDLTNSIDSRRILKKILAILRKERREFG